MAENTRVHTPYNFVPFANDVLSYPDREIPPHDTIDRTLLTGEIHLTLTADTPVFVSDGNGHFIQNGNGQYIIPGSSLRGLIRENMQILSFGLVQPREDLEDVQIYFRDLASARKSTGGPLKKYYRDTLDIKLLHSTGGKTFSIPQNVKAGYICKENGQYHILPVQGNYLRISRNHPSLSDCQNWTARTVKVVYKTNGSLITDLQLTDSPISGWQYGTLLFTGRPVGKVPNHLYVFPPMDDSAKPVPVNEADELSYREDLEKRRNSLKAYYDPNFWALPQDGEDPKPVFYILHGGHTYFGMTLFLRVGYKNSLSAGLPDQQKRLNNDYFLDYPHAILGFIDTSKREDSCRFPASFRSRVSFGDLEALKMPNEMPPVVTILGEPRPSYYPGYVEDGKHYNEDNFQLRGYKQYWLQKPSPVSTDKLKAASTLRPLPSGTAFHGVIRYKNLYPDELGLLLWATRLDKGCYQTVGMGKPYGYGRMKVTELSLYPLDLDTLYSPDGLEESSKSATDADINHFITSYIAMAEKNLFKGKRSLRETEELSTFFYIHSTIRESQDVRYMDLKEYQNVREPLSNVRQIKEALETSLDALKNKFNTRKL